MNSRLAPMPARFEGFPGLMQGGYLAGVAAGPGAGPTRVQIRRPAKPGDVLVRHELGDQRRVLHDDALAMLAFSDPIRVDDPALLDRVVGAKAAAACLPFAKPFPQCAGCGDRADGLGAQIRPLGQRMVGQWTPSDDLADDDGFVLHTNIWTVTDCFTSWALFADPPADPSGSYVTANIALEIRRPLRAGVTYLMQSWRHEDLPPGNFKLGSVVVGGSIEDEDGIVAMADQEMVRSDGPGMNLATNSFG
jgi:hypothetical protein